jgi:hypothetical protein
VKRAPLVEYVVRIMPPEGGTSDEDMAEALRAIEAYGHMNIRTYINERYVRGNDYLGEKGFTVEVVKKE